MCDCCAAQRLLEKLESGCPRLRRVVCLRKLCSRHGKLCQVRGSPCCLFGLPLDSRSITPTWCEETTLFLYNVHRGGEAAIGPSAPEAPCPRTPPRASASARAATPPTSVRVR